MSMFDGCDDYSIIASVDKLNEWLNSDEPVIRLTCVNRPDFLPTLDQVMNGVLDNSYYVRTQWAKCRKFRPTEDIIQIGIHDRYWEVRELWVLRDDITFDIMDIHKGLRDEHIFVRTAWASRIEWVPCSKRIHHMLDDLWPIKEAIGHRHDVNMPYNCIRKAISDPYVRVRITWAAHPSITLYKNLVNMCLKDTDSQVRLSIIASHLWEFTEEQISAGLNDECDDIRDAWKNKLAKYSEHTLYSDVDSIGSI